MAFQFCTAKMPNYVQTQSDCLNELLASEEFWQIKAELDEALGSMEQTNRFIDNIQDSLNHLEQFGAKGLRDLNADHGLEELMNVQASLITLQGATAALEDADQSLWDKFKDYCAKIWEAICNLFKALFGMTDAENKKVKALDASLSKADENKLKDTPASADVGTPEEATNDANTIKAAAAILVEIEGVNDQLGTAIAMITLDNEARTSEAEANIDKLEAKLVELEAKLDKETSEEKKPAESGKKTLGVLGWAKATLSAWCKEFVNGYNEAIKKADRSVQASARKSKENTAKLDNLNKAAKSKKNSKAKAVVAKGRKASSKASSVAQKAASKVVKGKKKQSKRASTFVGSASHWSDSYSADDNPEY